MDIVEKLRGAHWADKIAHEAADEIERLRKALKIINAWYPISVSRPMDTVRDIMDFANKTLKGGMTDADEIERLRGALQKIAAVDDEKLPTPVTQAEGVLWSTLDACVGLARKALGEKE